MLRYVLAKRSHFSIQQPLDLDVYTVYYCISIPIHILFTNTPLFSKLF